MNHFCNQCGTKLAADTLFCTNCGAAVAKRFAEEPTVEAVETLESLPEPETFSAIPIAVEEESTPVPIAIEEEPAPIAIEESTPEPPPVPQQPPPPVAVAEPLPAQPIVIDVPAEGGIASTGTVPLSGGKKVLIAIASVFISIFLFGMATAVQSWVILQEGLNNQTVSAMARAVLNTTDLTEFPIFDIVDASDINAHLHEGVSLRGDEVLYEAIFATIDDYYKNTCFRADCYDYECERHGMRAENIKELIEHRALMNFLGSIIDGGVEYIMGGEDSRIIRSEELVRLLERNEEDIRRITQYPIGEYRDLQGRSTDYEDIRYVLQTSGIDDITWGSTLGDNTEITSLRDAFRRFERHSILLLVILIVLIVGMSVLLVILHSRRLSNSLYYFGIPCALSGTMMIVLNFLINIFFEAFTDSFSFGNRELQAMQDTFTNESGNVILFSGLVVFGIGAAAIAVKVVMGLLKKDKRNVNM
jgi:hypothetical protein